MAPVGGVMVGMNRMNRDPRDRFAEPLRHRPAGPDQSLSDARGRERGYFFAPDPSSQMVSSIGGNVSTNAGRAALPQVRDHDEPRARARDGHRRRRPRPARRQGAGPPGLRPDRRSGRLGGHVRLVTAVTVRLLHPPEAVKTMLASFTAIEDASEAVSAIIAAGIVPAALEMLDEVMIRAINEGVGAGYPEGRRRRAADRARRPAAEVEAQAERIGAICRDHGALEVRVAARRGRARAPLEGAQGGGGRGRPPRAQLPAAGRGGAALEAAGDHARDASPSARATAC